MNKVVFNKILLFAVLISLVNIILFFFVPSSYYTFNLSLSLNEPWRFFTFQFFHVDIFHLLENVAGLIFVAFIAVELDVDFKSFLSVYLLSVFVVFLPISLVFPLVTVAGNSTGIYGVLALCLIKARKLVSSKITLPIIIVFIFATSILNFALCEMCFLPFFSGEFFHFSGFLAGMTLSFMPASKPKHILRI
jgi:membrane associated rhomboid family serine protease